MAEHSWGKLRAAGSYTQVDVQQSKAAQGSGRSFYGPLPRRPNAIPLKKESLGKIRTGLAAYRAEYGKAQISSTIKDSAYGTSIVTSAESVDASDAASIATGFSGNVEAEAHRQFGNQSEPVLKARKYLLRCLGTCSGCRAKKAKVRFVLYPVLELLRHALWD